MNCANSPAKKTSATRSGNPKAIVTRKPRRYLAGDITNNDWRYELIPQLRSFEWGGDLIATGRFEYAGPYFTASGIQGICPASAATETKHPDNHAAPSLQAIVRHNDKALQTADLVIAYITSMDCYHTLAEIGRAAAGKRQPKIIIVLSPAMSGKRFPQNIPNVGWVIDVAGLSGLRLVLKAGLALLKADQKTGRGGRE